MSEQALWVPSINMIKNAQSTAFCHFVNQRYSTNLNSFDALYDWSIQDTALFWEALWDFCEISAEYKGALINPSSDAMEGFQFFPEARLNFAENLLQQGRAEDEAIVFVAENGDTKRLSYKELRQQVASLALFLKEQGVNKGDRVAAYLPNMAETIIAMLASTTLGAIWSSCSPEFGVQGALDRFSQIEPKVLFVTNAYHYNGKTFDMAEKNKAIIDQLSSLITHIMTPLLDGTKVPEVNKALFADIISKPVDEPPAFVQMDFNDPLYIMFSSGTTGVPKCIVHGVGGTLLQHLKEHRLHLSLQANDRFFYATTCGWMMWNWLASGLASGATIILYDGSLFYPNPSRLFDLIDAESISIFGISAKYIEAIQNSDLKPIETHELSSLRCILSTGSPLLPEAFEYIYQAIKKDVCLASISGGTDIISCFALGSDTLPVYKGELQCRGLGMAVESWNAKGEIVYEEKGELVCVKPFPSMPIGFWNDKDGVKYHSAYFDKFPGVWCHGDYVKITQHRGLIFYGRSDAVLNPGGVRIGTAEIYRYVDQMNEIKESIVIGQAWNNDVRVILFVSLTENVVLDDALIQKIKLKLRNNATARHVPSHIISVSDIPKTHSGKIAELAVRDIVHGRDVKNKEALANPQALKQFENLKVLSD